MKRVDLQWTLQLHIASIEKRIFPSMIESVKIYREPEGA